MAVDRSQVTRVCVLLLVGICCRVGGSIVVALHSSQSVQALLLFDDFFFPVIA